MSPTKSQDNYRDVFNQFLVRTVTVTNEKDCELALLKVTEMFSGNTGIATWRHFVKNNGRRLYEPKVPTIAFLALYLFIDSPVRFVCMEKALGQVFV